MTRHRAMILPVVLVLIGLLALIMAGFMFFVRAEIAGLQAQRDGQQAQLAVDSGLEEVLYLLRENADNIGFWYDNPERFRHILVWSPHFNRDDDPIAETNLRSREAIFEEGFVEPVEAWRYSVVAPHYESTEYDQWMRYGLTPEASKLNLNAATETEITRLFTPLLLDLRIENPDEIVACLLDWLDEDNDPRPGGAEADDYYTLLEPGYYPKNGPLDTIDELLLVKGFSAAVLYGEDTNRNGLLDGNEDDGEETFPYYDNADGRLDRGIAPFVTVWSREPQAGNNNQNDQQGGNGENENDQLEGALDELEGLLDEDENEEAESSESAAGSPWDQAGENVNVVEGLININTAPARVLAALEGMPEGAAEEIVATRGQLMPEELESANWLTTSGAIDAATFAAIQDKITTRAVQFRIEIVGYGDHTKLARRVEWIVEMRGSLPQVIYERDLTSLGLAWPIDEDEYLPQGQE